MLTMTFDTLKTIEILQDAGMPVAQAKAMSHIMQNAKASSDAVTKTDFKEYKSEMKSDFEELEMRMDAKFSAMELRIIKWFVGIALGQFALLTGIFLQSI